MEESRYQLHISFVCTGVFTIIACVLRTLALFFAFDRDPGYFRTGALLPILYYALVAVSFLWFCSFFFRVKKGTSLPEFPAPELPSFCGGAVAAVAFLVAAAILVFTAKSQAASAVVPLAAAAFLLAGCAYFLLPLFGKENGSAQILCGYALIFGTTLLLCTTYFDRYTPMNAPHKVAGHLALLSVLFAMLSELRRKVGKRAPRAEVFFTMVAFFLCFTTGLSGMIAFLGGVYEDLTYLAVDFALFAFSLYLAARNAGVFCAPADAPEGTETDAAGSDTAAENGAAPDDAGAPADGFAENAAPEVTPTKETPAAPADTGENAETESPCEEAEKN